MNCLSFRHFPKKLPNPLLVNATVGSTRETVDGFTKNERKVLREIAGEVYEWELHGHLEELDKAFSSWRAGKLLSSGLSAEIHEFHQHAARELWSMYQSLKEDQIVARGIAPGAIPEERLNPALREKIKPLSHCYRRAEGDAA